MSAAADPGPSPAQELAGLAGALAAELGHLRLHRVRRVPGPDPAPASASPPAVVEADGARPAGEAVRALAAACSSLEELEEAVSRCTACPLHQTRTRTVFADGDGSSGAMFVGEAPGANEDAQGVPFVGKAGALLSDIIEKGMGIERERAYIANVLKCRPPENRDPTAEEKATCTPWLDRQIELVDAPVLIPLGLHAARHLLDSTESMGRLRGRKSERGGRTVIPTYHPAFLLRSPHMKKACWEDIQLAMGQLGLSGPTSSAADPSTP